MGSDMHGDLEKTGATLERTTYLRRITDVNFYVGYSSESSGRLREKRGRKRDETRESRVRVAGNPAKALRKRFDDELIDLLLAFKWWDKEVEEINALIPILTCGDLEKVKREPEARLGSS